MPRPSAHPASSHPSNLHAVTGAFGYSGRFIAQKLLDRGHRVITLTHSPPRRDLFNGVVRAFPFHFDRPDELARSLEGVSVLYNTYWVRFDHDHFDHATAVENTLTLFQAARRAGVKRIVHVSITQPSRESALPYFQGKARLEAALQESGLSHAILRPAVLFGHDDILINNIAWALRRFPAFAIFGDGSYRLQPIHVEDFADLAVRAGASAEDLLVNALGPETFTYRELVATIGAIIGCRRQLVRVSPALGYWMCRGIGWWMNDVFLTREEIKGLMDGLLHVEAPPTGTTRLTDWARAHADTLGRHYASELARRRARPARQVNAGSDARP